MEEKEPINGRTFMKSPEERAALKIVHNKYSPKGYTKSKKDIEQNPLLLVVYVTNPSKRKDYKTTHSFKCVRTEIPGILTSLNDQGYKVQKIYYNHKVYHYV